jgi:hypothetical protein
MTAHVLRCLALAAVLLWAPAFLCGAVAQPRVPVEGTIGVNKVDLLAQYTGTASGRRGDAASLRVTRAMARKALADAREAGIRYMRVSMTGGGGAARAADDADGLDDGDEEEDAARTTAGALALWTTDPEAFWRQVDVMMDDLDRNGIQIVPVLAWGSRKFPAMAGEPTGEMFRDPRSKSWQLLERWVTEFVTRYRNRPTVLFYELTNELNNYYDLDRVKRCKRVASCSEGDRYTTADVIAYTERFAALLRRLDGSRKISSGFTIPRPSAEHLRARPEWITGRPDWTRDTREQFARNLRDIHQHVDIISIHMYSSRKNQRFGSRDAVDLLVETKRVADQLGKPLFVGEFGDRTEARTYTRRMIEKIRELRIPYSTVWAWELYLKSTYETRSGRHTRQSIEPGLTDDMVEYLRSVNGGAERPVGASDKSPPRVVLTWPLPCSRARAGSDVHAVASDDSGAVSKVEFLLDGQLVGLDTEAPYQASIDPGAMTGQKHRLTARAYDAAGNAAEFSSDVLEARTPRSACSVAAD